MNETDMVEGDLSVAPCATAHAPILTLVVPIFNEESVLPLLLPRLKRALGQIGKEYEIIFVNDGSTDQSLAILEEMHSEDPRIKILSFSRNFGKECAITAGLDFASGQAVVPIDADLQDPPELIAEFVEHWRNGYKVVNGVRRRRSEDSFTKRISANAFYRVINRLTGIGIHANAGDFRLLDRCVVDSLKRLRERSRFMKGLYAWVGYEQTSVFYDRPRRAAGKTKFDYWRLWNFALDGITGYSTLPVRFAGYLGILAALLSFVYGTYLIVRTLILGIDVPGYASLMVAILFFGGVQLIVLGIIGEYLGRMYEETKQRPLYIVSEKIGFDAD